MKETRRVLEKLLQAFINPTEQSRLPEKLTARLH